MFGRKKFDSKELGKRLAAYSGSAQDQGNWLRWLSIRTRSWHDLELVMKGGAARVFQVRAITAMLCWDHALDPFEGRVRTGFKDSNLYAGHVHADIEAHLPDAAAVVVNFCLQALDAGATAPEEARDLYNQCIPILLENIQDPRLGDELFKRFRPYDAGTPSLGSSDPTTFNLFDYAFFSNGHKEEWQ